MIFKDEVEKEMRRLAKENNVEPTENLPKIAKARQTMQISIRICPCAAGDADRGCISAKCLKEIQESGMCHCRAFRRKE